MIPDACVAITRNWDFDFTSEVNDPEKDKDAYLISKPVRLDIYIRMFEAIMLN